MTHEPAWYTMREMEQLLRCSRDTLTRFVNAGLLDALGSGRGRRITAASYRRVEAMIAEGIDVWQLLANREKPPVRLPMAGAVSTQIRGVTVGTFSRRKQTGNAQRAASTRPNTRPAWIKKITPD